MKAVLALEAVKRRRDERYERYVRPLDRKRDVLAAEVGTRELALTGTQQAEARRILGAVGGNEGDRRPERVRRASGWPRSLPSAVAAGGGRR